MWLHHLFHRHQVLVTVVTRHGQVITLKRCGDRQYDIGMLRRRCPIRL
ncbi:Uncharacterised protein [Vibrio cholerae]|nr:Uncharacterised protein [Vibrio cholerae]